MYIVCHRADNALLVALKILIVYMTYLLSLNEKDGAFVISRTYR